MPGVDRDSISIHYEVLGDGEPVAFLNGVMMTVQSWVLQSSVLRRRYRCVMHDFRGQLLSDMPTTAWRLEDHADDFCGILDELGIDSCHVVGTSYGGEVGMILALRHPLRVRTLTVISSVSETDGELKRAVGRWRQAALREPESLCRVSLPFNFSPQFIAANPEILEQGEARLAACPAEFFPAFARLIDAFESIDITDELKRIRCPTLVIVGELDRLKPPRFSRLIAARIPQSKLVLIPGAGHAVVIEKPEEVNAELLGFLEKHGG